ncbi:MAG: sensor domain-containing protein, partial [Rhizobiaceae bacterium]
MLGGGLLELIPTVLMVAGGVALPVSIGLFLQARMIAQRERSAVQSLEEVIENLGEGFYRTSLDGLHLSANPALVAISGFDSEAELIAAVGKNSGSWYVDPKRGDEFKKILAEEGRVRNFISEVFRDKTGERIWICENARLVLDPITKEPSHYEGTVTETTNLMMRIQEEEKLRKLTSHVPGGLFQLMRDKTGVFTVDFSSYGFRELLDLQSNYASFDIEHFVSLIHPEDLEAYNNSLRMSRRSGRVWSPDFRVVTDGGNTKWLKIQATPEVRSDHSVIWHGYIYDITTTKADEAEIRSLAYNDALTKLPNRRSLIERLEQKITTCQRRNEFAGLLFIDLDDFKALNDTHGHDVGDLLLIEISKRLSQVVRRSDTVARLAGDEFVVLLDHVGSSKAEAAKKASAIAQKVIAAFGEPFKLEKQTHFSSASIGGLTFCGEGDSVDDLLRKADTAMYEVKRSGRNAFKLYEEAQSAGVQAQFLLVNDLPMAVERGELELRLQPQLDRSGTICGAEALIRWNHPKLGLLLPDAFLGLAEQNGHMGDINSWILNEACAILKIWQGNQVTAGLKLAINIGMQQLADDGFPKDIVKFLKLHAIDASKLTLELTEKIISKNHLGNLQLFKRLKLAGVKLSLDDFGVDFSSLSLLADMPLDEIKIDGKFVKS